MKTKHGITVAGVLGTGGEYGMTGLEVDGGNEDGFGSCRTGTLYDLMTICCKLFAV